MKKIIGLVLIIIPLWGNCQLKASSYIQFGYENIQFRHASIDVKMPDLSWMGEIGEKLQWKRWEFYTYIHNLFTQEKGNYNFVPVNINYVVGGKVYL